MQNKIVSSLVADFLEDFGIKEKDETVQFEHFCNYCMFTLNYPDAYSTENFLYKEVHTGAGNDCGMDGILVVINDKVITNLKQAEEIINANKFEAKFIIVQAKTSSNFESGEMLKTGLGVKGLFSNSMGKMNEKISSYKRIIEAIFNKSSRMKSQPECIVYFVTTGKWTEDPNLVNIKIECEKQLEDLNYFSKISFIPIDSLRLSTIYKEIRNAITREIVIPKSIAFPPEISGIVKAIIGLVPINEYMKLITDEEGILLQGLFYDNVRSYLGENPVNIEILETLKNPDRYIQFPILNNGVTIVAKSLIQSGDKFTLSDYQIVNGCQTSNVLYKCRDDIKEDMFVPVKIIHSEDGNLINDVIRSTNRQTQVLDEAFESLKEFHKSLQDYYNTYKGSNRLYYERRTHEYDYDEENIKKTNVITLPCQLYSFVSMFLGEPHSVHRYYGELLRANANRVFQEGHKHVMYYTSAWTLHQVENAFRKHEIDWKWRSYRYHLIYMIRVFVCRLSKVPQLPRPTSKDMEKLCDLIMKAVSNERMLAAMLRQFVPILSMVEKNMKKRELNGNHVSQIKEFTTEITRSLDNMSIDFEK